MPGLMSFKRDRFCRKSSPFELKTRTCEARWIMSGFWWPGILFLLGAVNIARGMAEGRTWQSMQGGLWLIGIGLFFMIGFNWAILLILVGVSMLVGGFYRPYAAGCCDDDDAFHSQKRKRKNDDYEGDIFEV